MCLRRVGLGLDHYYQSEMTRDNFPVAEANKNILMETLAEFPRIFVDKNVWIIPIIYRHSTF